MTIPIENEDILVSKSDFEDYQKYLKSGSKILMTKVYFDHLITSTSKAYLIAKEVDRFWIPKSIIYQLDLDKIPRSLYVPHWLNLKNNKVSKHKCSHLKDLNGVTIFEGDTLSHPDGLTFIVVYKNKEWFARYDSDPVLSRLSLQIGSKGQAVVILSNGET